MPVTAGSVALEFAANLSRMETARDHRLARRFIGLDVILKRPLRELGRGLPLAAGETFDAKRVSTCRSSILWFCGSATWKILEQMGSTYLSGIFWTTMLFLGLRSVVRYEA